MAGVLAVLIHAAASSDSGFGAAAGDLLGQRLTEDMIAETPALAVQSFADLSPVRALGPWLQAAESPCRVVGVVRSNPCRRFERPLAAHDR
jgi:hypothetical protein